MKPNLTPRAIVALSVAAVSLFLLLCFSGYGRADAEAVMGPRGFSDTVAAWFVGPLGAGAHVLAVLGLAWGVIVYFQERTPDLVLRGVGTLALAASTAMLVGLVNGGRGTPWAGTVGTAGANTMIRLGAFGAVLGWVTVLALFGVSLVFATDWLFHTLRRGNRQVFDPRALPTEPPRGDLLEDPTDTEPREFVRAESRAAAHAQTVPVSEPKALEIEPSALPKGFTAVALEDRTVVRGPSGYAGVEFLPPSDELVAPDLPRRPDVSEERLFVGSVDDGGHGIAFEAPADLAPHGDDHESATQEVEERPEGGIGLADASVLVDEVFSIPSHFADSDVPHDGASAADEIASDLASAAATEHPAAGAHAVPAPAPEPVPAEPAATATDDGAPAGDAGFVEDEVIVGGVAAFDDDVLWVYEEPADAAPPAPAVAAVPTVAAAIDAAVAASPFEAVAVAEAPDVVAEAPEPVAEPVAEPESALTRLMQYVLDTPPSPAAPAAERVAYEPVPYEPAFEPAGEPAAAVLPPVQLDPAADVDTEVLDTDTVTDPVAVAPAVETAPEPAAAGTAAEPAPAAAPAADEAPRPAQLALFAAPACDLSRLHSMELDPLFLDAAGAILARGRASAVVLQRALGIGYARGLRILDQMTEAGMLGPDAPGGAREILFTADQWDAFRKTA